MRIALIALWGLLAWAVVQVMVFLPVLALGLILMPLLCRWAPIVTAESRLNPGVKIEVFRWAWAQTLFGNGEDGLSPQWWCDRCMVHDPTPWSRFSWFLRNPVSNMRFWPVISTRPDPARVRFIGAGSIPPDGVPGWFLAWQGPFVGFRWQCASWGVWLGWAVSPSDQLGMPGDWRACGFSVISQFMRF